MHTDPHSHVNIPQSIEQWRSEEEVGAYFYMSEGRDELRDGYKFEMSNQDLEKALSCLVLKNGPARP